VLSGVNYRILEASNGKEAAQQVDTTEVDLVIIDLVMPEQEGIETIRAMHRGRPGLKIIAMSGQFAGPLLRGAEYLGARASLAKPIRPDELLDTVARLMVGSRQAKKTETNEASER
jgi:DNA-binding NarL/FixJ family response regulator